MKIAIVLLGLAAAVQLHAAVEGKVIAKQPEPGQEGHTAADRKAGNANLAAELTAEVTQESKEMKDGLKNTANENGAGFDEELLEATNNVAEMKEEQKNNEQKLHDSQAEALDHMTGEIREANAQEFDKYKEAVTVQNEVKGVVSDVSTALTGVQNGLNDQVTRLQAMANKAHADLAGQIASTKERSAVAAKTVDDFVKTTIESTKADVDNHVLKLQNYMEKKGVQLEADMQSVQVDLTKARTTTEKEVNSGVQDAQAKLEEIHAELASTAEESAEIRQMMIRQNDRVNGKMNDETHSLHKNLDQSVAVMVETKEKVLAGSQEQVNNAVSDAMDSLDAEKKSLRELITNQVGDVNKGIADDNANVKHTKEILVESIADLTDENDVNLKNIQAKAADVAGLQAHADATETSTMNSLLASHALSATSLDEVKTYVNNQMTDVANEQSTVAGNTATNTNLQMTRSQSELNKRIAGRGENVDHMVADIDRTAAASAAKAESLLSKLEIVKTNAVKERKKVNMALPQVNKVIGATVNKVSKLVNSVDGQLQTSRTEVQDKIESSGKEISAASKKSISDASSKLTTSLKGTAADMNTAVDSMQQSLTELSDQSKAAFKSSDDAHQHQRAQVESAIERASKIADKSEIDGVQVGAEIDEEASELTNAEHRANRDMKSSNIILSEQVQDALRHTEQMGAGIINDTLTNREDRLNAFTNSAHSDITNDENSLSTYTREATNKYHEMEGKVANLDQAFGKSDAGMGKLNKDLSDKLADLVKQQAMLKTKSVSADADEKEKITKRVTELKQYVNDKVDEMAKRQGGKIEDMQRLTDQAFSQEYTREQLEHGKIASTINSWHVSMESELGTIARAVQETGERFDINEKTAKEADTRLDNEINGIGREIHEGQKQVAAAVEKENARVHELMRGESSGMQSLLGAVKTTQAEFSQKVSGMKKTFTNELNSFAQQGEAEAAAMSAGFDRLDANARSIASGFAEDTKASKAQLSHTAKRLSNVVHQTDAQLEDFKTEISHVRERRETEESNIQKQSEGIKKQLDQGMKRTVGKVDEMRTRTSEKFGELADEEKAHSEKLTSMVNSATTREEDMINAMQAKITSLEESNGHLMDYQTSFNKRTVGWRKEVERRIKELSAPAGESNLRAESLLQTKSMSELTALHAEMEALDKEHSRLTTHDGALEARVQRLAEQMKASGLPA